ncbi:MAG: WhiB family transcriptional regulator [Acidimicrobiia bacterium]
MNEIDEVVASMLSAPINEERPWMVFGTCRNEDPFLFFPQTPSDTKRACAICAMCPVRVDCLEYSLEAGERFGVWGGVSEQQRHRLLRQPA